MLRSVWAIGSLLLSAGLLLFGHGMHLTVLPLIAEDLHWSAVSNALTTSAYFLGFAAGCLVVPRWLLAIGHIRVFGVLVALATAALLCLSLLPWLGAWLSLRFVYGVAISGIYLTVESWLNAETQRDYRGAVLSVYAFVTLLAMFGAQLLLQRLELDRLWMLVTAAVFLSLAALPIGLTRRQAPRMVASPHLRLSTLLNPANLPAFVSGVLAGTFWALAPVFTTRLGLDGADTARFMAAAVGGGMLVVYPLGWLSDRIGRAAVLSLLGFLGLVGTLAYLLFVTAGEVQVALFGLGFGAVMMPLYALCVAFANDRAGDDDFVETGSVVIMANALGMVSGPIAAGWLLTGRSTDALLWFWAGAFAVLGAVAAAIRAAMPRHEAADTAAFELVPRTAPEVLVIDPRAPEEGLVEAGLDDAAAEAAGDPGRSESESTVAEPAGEADDAPRPVSPGPATGTS
ncbi:MAG: MFS transporter [Gammaproteobacteria bacterium]|nr:MFS transporter [Gammaproteobacteria bacterium]MCP5199855.1 MFS transporter [Gammaproteobacteria bacterium]